MQTSWLHQIAPIICVIHNTIQLRQIYNQSPSAKLTMVNITKDPIFTT